jgi:hypothetical protein
VRFWALDLAQETSLGKAQFWRGGAPPPLDARVLWVGAGTKDTGFSLTRLTFQITHATDADTDIERDFIVAELRSVRVIGETISYRAGQHLPAHVNHYVTDGDVTMARLAIEPVN